MNIQYTNPSIPLAWLDNNSQLTKGTLYAQIGNSPKLFTASENISNFIFNNTPVVGTPVKTRLVMTVFGLPSTSTGSIYLKNSFMSVVLTASNTPSTNQFYNNGAGVTAAERAIRGESIAYELRNNLTFNQYYNVWNQGATVFIEARVAGTEYNFDTSILTTNLTLLGGVSQTYTAGTNTYLYQSLLDYSTWVEVYVANGVYGQNINKRNSILTDIYSISPFNDASFAINLTDSIKPYVDVVLPTKRNTPTLVVKELDKQLDTNGNPILPVVRPYYITYGYEQRFGAGLEKKKFVTGQSRINFLLNGAFGILEDYDFTPYILDTTSTSPVKFMTSSPSYKETDYNSQEYLHFYRKSNPFELGNFGVEVTYQFNDLTTVTQSYPFGAYAGINGTLSLDISPNVLQLDSIELLNGKLIDNYKVKLYWTISSLTRFYSEERTYKMKRVCNSKVNNVIFLNEFGVFDTLNFTGEVEKSVERSVDYLKRPVSINTPNTGFNSVSDEVMIPIRMLVTESFTITSELVDNATYNHLSRILSSSAVFIYAPEDNRYRAIKIEDFGYNYNSKNDENILTLTYSFTVDNNTITR